MTREKCKKCGKGHKKLTMEKLCVYCYKDVHGTWSGEFRGAEEKNKRFRK